MDTYHGDSIGKKLARLDYWLTVRDWMGGAFTSSRHMVLASRDGGDISVLRGLGVPDGCIIAVERNPDAAKKCEEKHRIRVRVGDVCDVAAEIGSGRIGSALLDFCGVANESMGASVAAVARKIQRNGIVGWVYQRGRENPKTREKQKQMAERGWNNIPQAFRERAMSLLEEAKDAGLRAEDSLNERSFIVHESAQNALSGNGIALMTLRRISYHSTDVWSRGLPMGIEARWIYRTTNGRPSLQRDGKFTREVDIASKEWIAFRMELTKKEISGDTCRLYDWKGHAVHYSSGVSIDGPFCTPQALAFHAEQIEIEYPGRAASLLNLTTGELAAIRAHVTRETYEHKISRSVAKRLPEAIDYMKNSARTPRVGDKYNGHKLMAVIGDNFIQIAGKGRHAW